jgi:hypothetical protein
MGNGGFHGPDRVDGGAAVALRVGRGEGAGTGGGGESQGGSGAFRRKAAAPTGPWPGWARPQLLDAVAVAARTESFGALTLYRDWFAAPTVHAAVRPPVLGPLAGLYRRAHAGSGTRRDVNGVAVVDRADVVGRDGWWRTWGPAWRPLRSRGQSVRVLFTPQPQHLAAFVATVTAALREMPLPWLLACPTDPRQLLRAGHAVLHLPELRCADAVIADVAGLLAEACPPLCLPLAPGVAVAGDPGNGMTFGEHRCHLISLALGLPRASQAPLSAIAEVFATHGVDPSAPHR